MTDTTDDAPEESEPTASSVHPPVPIASGLAFSGLMNTRSTEAMLRWDGFRTALQINLASFVGITLWLRENRTNGELILAFIACLIGVSWNYFHYKLLARDGKFFKLWNQSVVDLETVNGIQGGLKIFSSERYEELRNREPTIQYMLRSGSIIFILTWCGLSLNTLLLLIEQWRPTCQ